MVATLCCHNAGASSQQIAGWAEPARLEPQGIDLEAKLDTGAEHSSVNASEMAFFARGGREHVRFTVRNRSGVAVEVMQPVVRHTQIKRHSGGPQNRPVVRLAICIGNVLKQVEVNLVDRTGFQYPLLVGRSYLAGDFLVDPSQSDLLRPACPLGAIP